MSVLIRMQVPFDSGSGRVGVSAGLWVRCSLLNHVSIGMAKPHQNWINSCCIKATKTPAPSVPFTAYGVFCQILR